MYRIFSYFSIQCDSVCWDQGRITDRVNSSLSEDLSVAMWQAHNVGCGPAQGHGWSYCGSIRPSCPRISSRSSITALSTMSEALLLEYLNILFSQLWFKLWPGNAFSRLVRAVTGTHTVMGRTSALKWSVFLTSWVVWLLFEGVQFPALNTCQHCTS